MPSSVEAYLFRNSCDGCVALNTYYNGQLSDNVLAPESPGAGYALVRTEGYAYANTSLAGPVNTTMMNLWVNSALHDHWGVATNTSEAAAKAAGYTLQGSVAVVSTYGPPSPSRFFWEMMISLMLAAATLPVGHHPTTREW